MWLFSFLQRRHSKLSRSVRSSLRPSLEALEDRCLLSTAGALDPTFGNGAGFVTTSISNGNDTGHSTLIQPNGDIVAVGTANSHAELTVERYNLNGTLDTSFGSGGIALASFGQYLVYGGSSTLDPYAGTSNGNDDVVQEGSYNSSYQILARYNTNGTPDSTFGTGGEVMTAFQGMNGVAAGGDDTGVVVTSSGQLVALNDNAGQFVLARYNSNGSLDTTFGQGGYVITAVSGGVSGYTTLLQQPNSGDLIVTHAQGGGVWDLYRFTANGTLDTSFGTGGIVTTTAAGGPEHAALYLNAGPTNDGQIVVAGQASNGTLLLARYNTNGSLDNTFGTGGIVQTQISIGFAQDVALDTNGRIVVTGDNSAGSAIELARINVNGTPDTTFGNGGLVTTTVGTSSVGEGLAIYPIAGTANDRDIVVVGPSSNGTKSDVSVARYLGQATTPYFTIAGPSSVTAGTAGAYTITVFNPDGSADTGYSGTVHIASSDPKAVLPADFTITGGTATFSATLKTAGVQSLAATDTGTSGINGSDAAIQVNAAAATQFVLSGPSSARAGTAFSLTVTALDAFGNVATGYVGTVKFTDSVTGATLPGNYTFTAADSGVHTFTGLKLKTKGKQTITVIDTGIGTILGSLTIDVT
jgi:uncharacterized delta-60 repeat protein